MGRGRPVLSGPRDLRADARWPPRPAPAVGRGQQSLLGLVSQFVGRLRPHVDRARHLCDQVSGGHGRVAEADLADRARRRRPARHAVLRRRARGALPCRDDAGDTWSLVRGLYDHPHRPQWKPGGGGLCLHTILPDPARRAAHPRRHLHRRRTTAPTTAARRGRRATSACAREFLPPDNRYPEFGQCVHKIAQHPSKPDRLFLQNHWGLYRSDDRGDSWQDIANGVPSDFGFCDGDRSARPGHRLHRADRIGPVPLHAGRQDCASTGRRTPARRGSR